MMIEVPSVRPLFGVVKDELKKKNQIYLMITIFLTFFPFYYYYRFSARFYSNDNADIMAMDALRNTQSKKWPR